MTKDEALALHAVRALADGQRVLFVTSRPERVQAALDRIAAALPAHLVSRIWRGRGDEGIRTTNGASVSFRVTGNSSRGYSADVLLLDGVSDADRELALPCIAGSDVGQVYDGEEG